MESCLPVVQCSLHALNGNIRYELQKQSHFLQLVTHVTIIDVYILAQFS